MITQENEGSLILDELYSHFSSCDDCKSNRSTLIVVSPGDDPCEKFGRCKIYRQIHDRYLLWALLLRN